MFRQCFGFYLHVQGKNAAFPFSSHACLEDFLPRFFNLRGFFAWKKIWNPLILDHRSYDSIWCAVLFGPFCPRSLKQKKSTLSIIEEWRSALSYPHDIALVLCMEMVFKSNLTARKCFITSADEYNSLETICQQW